VGIDPTSMTCKPIDNSPCVGFIGQTEPVTFVQQVTHKDKRDGHWLKEYQTSQDVSSRGALTKKREKNQEKCGIQASRNVSFIQ
jgi:hypothetical protein